jgi:hypothetical protein
MSATALFVSLASSGARKNRSIFERWFTVLFALVIFEYIALIGGIILLLHVNLSLVDVNFPLYHEDQICYGKDKNSSCIINSDTQGWEELVDCKGKSMYESRCQSWIYFVHQSKVQIYQRNVILIFSVLTGSVIIFHLILFWRCGVNKNDMTDLLEKYSDVFKMHELEPNQLQELSISEMTACLQIPLGDALRLRNIIQEQK